MATKRPSSSSYRGTRTRSSSTSSGGQSYDPYIRDSSGNPIGTRAPPSGSTPESIAHSMGAAGGGSGGGGGYQLAMSVEQAKAQDVLAIRESTQQRAQQILRQSLKQSGLSQGQSQALARRKMISRIAQARGRAFTQREANRYLGGGQGIRNLRQATQLLRKEGVQGSSYVRSLYDQIIQKERNLRSPIRQSIGFTKLNLQPSLKKGVPKQLEKIYRGAYSFLDKFSGGRLTNKKLDKIQDQLNKKVDDFNRKFGENQSLSPESYDVANQLSNSFQTTQVAIDKARAGSSKPLEDIVNKTSSRGTGGKLTAGKIIKTLRGDFGKGFFSKGEQARSAGIVSALAGAFITGTETPGFFLSLIKNPKAFVKSLKQVPSALKGVIKEDVRTFKLNPQYTMAKVGTQYYVFRGTGEGLRVAGQLTKRGITRLSPYFKKLETSPLGIRKIVGVDKVGDIELIEERGTRLRKVNPEKAVVESGLSKQLKPIPSLPSVNLIQKKILEIVKRRGDVVSGSYAQNVFLKRKFIRAFKDLDILTLNRSATIKALRQRFGKRVTFHKKFKSIEVKYKGKVVADLVEFAQGEKVKGFGRSFVQRYGFARVKGLNVVRPQVRLASKVGQLGIGKRGKVLKDIELLYGKKGKLFNRPSFKGAYGYTKQEKFIGKRLTLTSSQSDLLVSSILKRNKSLRLKKWFFATPEVGGVPQVRVTRLGLPSSQEASLIDLLSGKASLTRGKPQIFVLPKEKIFSAPRGINKSKFIKTKGFVVPRFSTELEVVLGKGFIIQKGKQLATSIIDGNVVKTFQLKKIKIPRIIKSEFKKLEKLNQRALSKSISPRGKQKLLGQISKRQSKLNTKLKRITKIDYFSRAKPGRRIYPLGRKLSQLASRISRRGGSKRISSPFSIPRRGGSGSSFPRIRSIPRRGSPGISRISIPRRVPSSPSRVLPRYPRYSIGGGRPRARIRIFGRTSRIKRKLPKAIQSFNVYAKSGRKFVKINKGVLSRQDALNRGAYISDRTLNRTWKIVSVGKRKSVYGIPQQEKGYFRKTSYKFRPYRIRSGMKFNIEPKYIEKGGKKGYILDTRGERRGISVARYLKGRFRSPTRTSVSSFKPKRRITATRRRQLLKQLVKARRVLARKR